MNATERYAKQVAEDFAQQWAKRVAPGNDEHTHAWMVRMLLLAAMQEARRQTTDAIKAKLGALVEDAVR